MREVGVSHEEWEKMHFKKAVLDKFEKEGHLCRRGRKIRTLLSRMMRLKRAKGRSDPESFA
jgi:hypothetical protein